MITDTREPLPTGVAMFAEPLMSSDRLAGYERDGLFESRTLWDLVGEHEAGHAAVICPRRGVVSYGELRSEAEGLAAAWAASGLGRGDVVILHLPNWYEIVLSHLALTRLGAVTLCLLPSYREKELRFIAELSGAKGIVCAPGERNTPDAALYESLVSDLGEMKWWLGVDDVETLPTIAARGEHSALPALPDPADVTILMATSGTTGEAKLVMHSHRSTVGGVLQAVGREMGIGADEVMCMPSPIAHATGLQYGARLAPAIGATLLLVDAWDPVKAADLVAEHNATWFMGATPFLYDLLELAPESLAKLASLRRFVCGGAPIPVSLAAQAEATFTDVSFMSAWGMSETGIVTLVPANAPAGAFSESDGSAVPGWEVKIVDTVSGVEAEVGSEGEIVCRGAALFHGYYLRPELTAEAVRDGWMHTGDLGCMDASGRVRCLGRIKDLVIRGGLNISAVEVEDAVRQHDAIREVAVVGAPDPRLGERLCAFVVCDGEPPSVAELSAFLLGMGMSKTKLPERVIRLDALPSTSIGKVQKFRLRQMLEGPRPAS